MTLVAAEFTGKERDQETGLDYFGARYFSGAQGRFTSPDFTAPGSDPVPIPGADFDNPQNLNLYAYVRNNPLSHNGPGWPRLRRSDENERNNRDGFGRGGRLQEGQRW